jgi:adenylate cyclase
MRYYLPENVHRELTAQALDPANLNRVVFSTCLATDMSGFSTIAEQMRPGELAQFLTDYFDSLAQPLKRHGVDVTEFRADAIMCAWTGDPLDPSVRKQPILASLEAARAIADFKDRHQMAGAKLRIGMEAGEVYVGHAGGGGHFVYSIVGDSANTASRIEGLNKHLGTQILATRSVAAGFDTDLLLRPLGRFRFVGKTEALPIVEVLAYRGDATPAMVDLCDRFAEALDRFGRADWTWAGELFKAILGRYPQDGPTAFYLDLCERYAKGQAPTEDPAIVNMTAK